MLEPVSGWRQQGRVYVWRYAEPNRNWGGWHFTGDPAGCRSTCDLLDRMRDGGASHPSLNLSAVSEAILDVPNYGHPCKGKFSKLRIEFDPGFPDLRLQPGNDRLTLRLGNARVQSLRAAFADVEIGQGDFGIAPSDDRKAHPWMFWPMPWSLIAKEVEL